MKLTPASEAAPDAHTGEIDKSKREICVEKNVFEGLIQFVEGYAQEVDRVVSKVSKFSWPLLRRITTCSGCFRWDLILRCRGLRVVHMTYVIFLENSVMEDGLPM